MKKLKIALSTIFMLMGCVVLAACGKSGGETNRQFDAAKIEITNEEVTYNGDRQSMLVSYVDENVNGIFILYSTDEINYKSISEFGFVDAGRYDVFYKLSASGYDDYLSSEAVEFIINPAEITVDVDDVFVNVNWEDLPDMSYEISSGTVFGSDDLDISFECTPIDEIVEGQTYLIKAISNNPNYSVISNDGTCYAVNNVVVFNDGSFVSFETLTSALDNVANESIVKLFNNVELGSSYEFTTSIVIDGQGEYKIMASDDFVSNKNNMFVINTNIAITLKGVTVNANGKTTVIRASKGILTIDGAIITGGYANDYVAGVNITSSASFIMTSGRIEGNIADGENLSGYEYLVPHANDLWIGANATGSLASITGGYIGYIFVNSNEYSANNPGSFTLDGGVVDYIYVEYDSGYGATFIYESGTINNLYVSTSTTGIWEVVEPVEGTTYKGGESYNIEE